MENILEDQRRLHEERERLIDTQTKEILRKKATVSRRINFELFAHLLQVLIWLIIFLEQRAD